LAHLNKFNLKKYLKNLIVSSILLRRYYLFYLNQNQIKNMPLEGSAELSGIAKFHLVTALKLIKEEGAFVHLAYFYIEN